MLPSRHGAAGNPKGCSWLVATVCTRCRASKAFAESAPPLPACSTACTPLAHKEVPLRQRVKCITGALDGAAFHGSHYMTCGGQQMMDGATALCCLGAVLCYAGSVRAAGCCTLCSDGLTGQSLQPGRTLGMPLRCPADQNGYAIYFSRGVLPSNKDGEVR